MGYFGHSDAAAFAISSMTSTPNRSDSFRPAQLTVQNCCFANASDRAYNICRYDRPLAFNKSSNYADFFSFSEMTWGPDATSQNRPDAF